MGPLSVPRSTMSSASIEKQVSDIEVSQEPPQEHYTQTHDVDPQKVFWKLDIRLVPLACLLYLLSFLYVSLTRERPPSLIHLPFQGSDEHRSAYAFPIADKECHLTLCSGNAKIAGLVGDLRLTGLRYNLCAAILLVRILHSRSSHGKLTPHRFHMLSLKFPRKAR